MSTEHITVKMGLDKSGLNSGLSGAMSQVKSLGSALKSAFAVGAIATAVRDVIGFSDSITDAADSLEVSTTFMQRWQGVMEQAGVRAEQSSIMLERFRKSLSDSGKSGSDLEQELMALSDRMKATSSPADRASLAIEAFGRRGLLVLPAMRNGADSLAASMQGVSIATEDALAKVDELGDRLSASLRTARTSGVIGLAWITEKIEYAARAWGRFSVTGSLKGDDLNEKPKRNEAMKSLHDSNKEIEADLERQVKIEAVILDYNKQRARVLDDIATKERNLADAVSNWQQSKDDRGSGTLADIAGMTPRNQFGAQQKWLANQVIWAEHEAEAGKAHGNKDYRDRALAYADKLRKQIVGLTDEDSGRGWQKTEKAIIDTNDILKETLKVATTDGFYFRPKNGK